jgi:hypothetical protein
MLARYYVVSRERLVDNIHQHAAYHFLLERSGSLYKSLDLELCLSLYVEKPEQVADTSIESRKRISGLGVENRES